MDNEDNNLLTLDQASQRLGVKPITLRKWDREGKLVATRVGPRRDRRYQPADIEQFLRGEYSSAPKWQEYIRSNVTYHHIDHVFDAITSGFKNIFGYGITNAMAFIAQSTMYWYYDGDELRSIGKKIVNRFLSSRSFLRSIIGQWHEAEKKLTTFMTYHSADLIRGYSKKQIIRSYDSFQKIVKDWYGVTMCIDPIDEFLIIEISNQLRKLLKKNNFDAKEFIHVYSVITSPLDETPVNAEKKDVARLADKLQKKKMSPDSHAFDLAIQALLERYWWIYAGWGRVNMPAIERQVRKHVESFTHAPAKILDALQNFGNRKTVKEYMTRYRLSRSRTFAGLLKIYNTFVVFHDERKEMQMRLSQLEYAFLDLIAKHVGISASLLEWADSTEILALLTHKRTRISERELLNRSGKFFIRMEHAKRVFVLSGRSAEREYAKNYSAIQESVADIQGMSASTGKVSGEAYVAISVTKALKIPNGAILVTGMTTPDFIPAMKRAAAIVTDEGGMTCHAAIVSRELGIPCIVGTKFGTKVIATGDAIEVAANHGVVRLLGKAN